MTPPPGNCHNCKCQDRFPLKRCRWECCSACFLGYYFTYKTLDLERIYLCALCRWCQLLRQHQHAWSLTCLHPCLFKMAHVDCHYFIKLLALLTVHRRSCKVEIGHGLKCENGLYGRSPDRSARFVKFVWKRGLYSRWETRYFFMYRYRAFTAPIHPFIWSYFWR